MTANSKHEVFAPAIVLGVGLVTILTAWGFELIGGFQPCKLCLEERLPYYVGLPLALAALLAALAGAKPTVTRKLLLAASLVFAIGAGLGVYHAGAEWGWWSGPSDCGATGGIAAGTAADLLDQLKNIRIVSCTEASWRFLFLSFAGWNAVISLFLVVVGFWGTFRPLAPESEIPGAG
jgi:disulfide bond formation protein DsbB